MKNSEQKDECLTSSGNIANATLPAALPVSTEEGNKLIAEILFNAFLITDDKMYMGGDVPHYTLNIDGIKRNYRPSELKFDKSFDWIIPAINRLKWNTGAKMGLFSNHIYCRSIFDVIVDWLIKSKPMSKR